MARNLQTMTIKQRKFELPSVGKKSMFLEGTRKGNGSAKLYVLFSRKTAAPKTSNQVQCTFVNFPTRTRCFKCQTPQIGIFSLSPALRLPLTWFRHVYLRWPARCQTTTPDEQWGQRCFTRWIAFAIPVVTWTRAHGDRGSSCKGCFQAVQT